MDLVEVIPLLLGSPSIPIPLDSTDYLLVFYSSIVDEEVASFSIIFY